MALARRVLFSRKLDILGENITYLQCAHKHYNPKFAWLRKMKYIDLGIEFNKKLTREDKERNLRDRGVFPARVCQEIPIYMDSTMHVFEPYVPTDGDGKYTSLSKKITSALNVKESALQKGKNMMAIRKIRKFIENFNEEEFAQKALDIYIKAHSALARKDINELEKYATEKAICLMTINAENKTIRWQYIESLDPPKTVHVRTASIGTKENLFAQITVRFHSKQILAIYDRFGRLMYGSEILAKDVLEFGVFEIHLTNMNGTYKLHHKIIPDWTEQRYSVSRTCIKPKEVEDDDEDIGEEYKLISETEDEEKNVIKQ